MRLDMLKAYAFGRRDGGERTNLVEHQVLDLSRAGRESAASKADEIREPRVRADGHARRACGLHRRSHHTGIPGVETAGDVR